VSRNLSFGRNGKSRYGKSGYGLIAALLLLGTLIAYRGSEETAVSASTAVSPALAANAAAPSADAPMQSKTPAPGKAASNAPAPVPLASVTPVKSFQVQPPASFSNDQLPGNSPVEFQVQGRAGQVLVVEAPEIYRVLVRPPSDGGPLKVGGDNEGRWFYALPQTGTYTVLYAPTRSPQIAFSFLNPADPKADPGIRPEQVSIDFGQFARKEDLRILPYDLEDGEDYLNSSPAHLGMENEKLEFHVIPVAGYSQIFKKNQPVEGLAAGLRSGGKNISIKKLPYPVYKDGGVNLAAPPEMLEGNGWRGLRWIAGFGQDVNCRSPLGGQKLAYVFEGISNDGRYFIMLRAPVSHPETRTQLSQACIPEIERNLAAYPPGSFRPDIEKLDAVIKSLKIQP
jgi:hypothetical protein